MKRSNFLAALLTMLFGLSLISFSFAQDSTQVKQQKRLKDGTHVGEPVKDQKRLRQQIQDPTSTQHGAGFVDENGDGYNDNAPDHDGDGIPNGLDPDYTGPKVRSGKGAKGFVDLNGDGLNDNVMKKGANKNHKGGYGPADGTGNKGVGPQDGTGRGSKAGDCDGTGPKGKGKGKRGSGK